MKNIEKYNPQIKDLLSGDIIDTGMKFDVSFLNKNMPNSRIETILEITNNKNVIHFGCTDHLEIIDDKIKSGNHFHSLLIDNCTHCIGIDKNRKAIDYLKEKYKIKNLYCADILKLNEESNRMILKKSWDFLILGEIIEHINNPVDLLHNIKKSFSGKIKYIIITAPNAYSNRHLSSYNENNIELINSDHRYWFTPYTILKVLHESKIKIIDLLVADPVFEKQNKLVKFFSKNKYCSPHNASTLVAIGKL